jgi:hypothetical protein
MLVPFQADGLSGSRHRARADGQNRDDAFPASPYRDTSGQPETSNAPSLTGGSTQCDQDTAVRDLRSQPPPQDSTHLLFSVYPACGHVSSLARTNRVEAPVACQRN